MEGAWKEGKKLYFIFSQQGKGNEDFELEITPTKPGTITVKDNNVLYIIIN